MHRILSKAPTSAGIFRPSWLGRGRNTSCGTQKHVFIRWLAPAHTTLVKEGVGKLAPTDSLVSREQLPADLTPAV